MYITKISSITNLGKRLQPNKPANEKETLATPILRKDIAILKTQLQTILGRMSTTQKTDYLTGKTKYPEIKELTDEIVEIRRIIQSRGENPFED